MASATSWRLPFRRELFFKKISRQAPEQAFIKTVSQVIARYLAGKVRLEMT